MVNAHSDEVTLSLIYDREAAHGKSIRFIVPETNQEVWLPKSLIKIEDNPIQGLEIDVICKRWLADKQGLI